MAFTAAHLLMKNHSGGDSVAMGIVSLFPNLPESRSPPVPLRTQVGFQQNNATSSSGRSMQSYILAYTPGFTERTFNSSKSSEFFFKWSFTSTEKTLRTIRDGGPGRPPRLSHSSCALIVVLRKEGTWIYTPVPHPGQNQHSTKSNQVEERVQTWLLYEPFEPNTHQHSPPVPSSINWRRTVDRSRRSPTGHSS